ncbi:hypothetical protein GCM10011572_06970 [Pseudoduganella buxea]|uniref:Uncharacterized protein n=1 Tax=Pseudoduganella buxea TaxID=1949069 RepID=A0ABQ1K5N4_9BURK|nr:hypothetical protein GCM10011572_06970 [Pseudoduganella buxea]
MRIPVLLFYVEVKIQATDCERAASMRTTVLDNMALGLEGGVGAAAQALAAVGPNGPGPGRPNCPAASASAWRWRAPSCTSLRCCCWTSPWARWTR